LPVSYSGMSFFHSSTSRPPSSTHFPYTTLFRSDTGSTASGHEALHRRARPMRALIRRFPGIKTDLGSNKNGTIFMQQGPGRDRRSEEHTSELQSRENVVCRLLLEKKKSKTRQAQ